ncbi:MAG: hypothetical protein ACI9MC_001152 [Kiritimatiellia bacterium]
MLLLLILATAQAASPTDIADTLHLSLMADDSSALEGLFPPKAIFMQTCMSMVGAEATCDSLRGGAQRSIGSRFQDIQLAISDSKLKLYKAEYNGITPSDVPADMSRLHVVNFSLTHKKNTLNVALHLLRTEETTYLQYFKVADAE